MSIFKEKQKILEEALSFQGDLVHLLEEPLPKGIRSTMYYCVSLVLTALTIASVFKVDVVVQGAGKLTYDGQPIVLQAFERAVLRTLLVKPGDMVKKGQVLATLDPTFSQADLTALEYRQKTVSAQVQRMEAEAYGNAYHPAPADGPDAALQSEVYIQRTTEYRSRLKAHDEAIEENQAGLLRIQKEKQVLEQQLVISTSVEEIQGNLLKSKTSSPLEFLGAKSARLHAEREFHDASDRLVEKGHQLQTVTAQKDSFVQEWRRSLLEELSRQRSEQRQVEAGLTKSLRIKSLVDITAPEDGTVLDIANRSVGSVIRDTEAIIVLAPSAAPLLCEIELSSSTLGEVAIGDPVLIKVDAFPYQRFGGLEGKIRSISHESHAPGTSPLDLESVVNKHSVTGGSHRVSIELTTVRLPRLPANRCLFPGMTAGGEVYVGKRRLITYLLDPLIKGLRESFRET